MQITFHPFGSRALLIKWEQRIDPEINRQVIQLANSIEGAAIAGVQYCIPAYCSLTVGYHPEQITFPALREHIFSLATEANALSTALAPPRQITIPVCYEDEFAPDIDWLSKHSGLAKEYIISLHTSTVFRVYMIGFLPGFPYMGTLPEVLNAPRKATPRKRVPPGSVAVAGLQTGIYPFESPGGWQLIGRTPLKLFDPERETPFYLQAGDEVRFQAIDRHAFFATET